MSDNQDVLLGASLPDALDIPSGLIEGLRQEVVDTALDAEKNPRAHNAAVARLQYALGSNEQAVKARIRRSSLISLKQAGYTYKQIAKMLGIKPATVKHALWRARKDGTLNDLRDILEHDTSAMAIDTINHHLRKHDKDVAVKHLEGMGFYKNHSNVKNEGGAGFSMPPLQINVVVKNEIGAAAVTPETFDVSEMSVGVPREDTAP